MAYMYMIMKASQDFGGTSLTVPFPVSEQLLSRFAAYLYKEGLRGGTVKSYMAAVRHAQISLGLRDPCMSDMPQLGYIIRGIKKATGGPPRTRLPITPDLLRVLRKSWSPGRTRMGQCCGPWLVCAFLASCVVARLC